MAATYKGLLTNNGKALIASATLNNKINYSHIAVGDGNGSVPNPLETRTALVNEKARIALNVVEINPNNTNQIICEAIIPSNLGGFYIRELGLYAGATMVVNASYPPTYKPLADEGGAREIALQLVINIQNAEVIALYLDDSLIYATRAWVETNYIRRNELVDNLTSNDATKPISAKQGKILQDNKLDKTANAESATKLKTARKIQLTGSVFGEFIFDGTTDIACELSSEDLDVVLYSPIPYSKTIAPSGYLIMMGQIIVEAQHPKLYARYGGTLPDMRGEFIRGFDTGRGIDENRAILSNQNATAVGFYVGGLPDNNLISFIDMRNVDSEYTDVSDGYRRYTSSGDKGTAKQILKSVRPRNISYNYIVKAG